MLGDLLPLVAALALAAAVYGWRERRRRQIQIRPPFPEMRLDEAWQWWQRGMGEPADLALAPRPPEALAPDDLGRIETSLLETERRTLAADHPRIALRQAILERATLALYLESVLQAGEAERPALLKGYEPGMEPWLQKVLSQAEVEWPVLRRYAHWKYDDAIEEDWFHRYFLTAKPYIREKVRLARECLLRTDAGSLRLVEIYDQLLQELVQKSLKAAPKRRFARPDLR
ncbi:MAG TPA: hypothetical protein VG672_16105 [Bryobacteraceae bacterium]|nr:hypothetical protein [Bryobacteraceae bacterium]